MGTKYENLLEDGTGNVVQSFYDNFLKSNADFRNKAGFRMTVIRESIGVCCAWCQELVGTYDYDSRPSDIYARHKNCTCIVTTKTERGTYQDAWSRKEYESQREARIARADEIIEEIKNNNSISAEERIKRIIDIQSAAANPFGNTTLNYNPNAVFKVQIDDWTATVNSSINDACKSVIDLAQDGNEHLILVDTFDGSWVFQETGDAVSCGSPDFWKFIKNENNKEKSFCFVHSHLIPGGFSETDMRTLLGNNPVNSFVAAQIDGKTYVVSKASTPHTLNFDKLYEKELTKLNVDSKNGKINSIERNVRREQIIVDRLIADFTKGVKVFE